MPDENVPQTPRELTFGEKAVWLTFNPSWSTDVDLIKEAAAKFIDLCNDARNNTTSWEIKRMCSEAITNAQTAQMRAVKSVTRRE